MHVSMQENSNNQTMPLPSIAPLDAAENNNTPTIMATTIAEKLACCELGLELNSAPMAARINNPKNNIEVG